jgi:hypothetical protein
MSGSERLRDEFAALAEDATDGPWVLEHTARHKRVLGKYDDGEEGAEVAGWIPDGENDPHCVSDHCAMAWREGRPCGHEEQNQAYSDSETADAKFIAFCGTHRAELRRALGLAARVEALRAHYATIQVPEGLEQAAIDGFVLALGTALADDGP